MFIDVNVTKIRKKCFKINFPTFDIFISLQKETVKIEKLYVGITNFSNSFSKFYN